MFPSVAILMPVYDQIRIQTFRAWNGLQKLRAPAGRTHFFDSHGLLVTQARQHLTQAALGQPDVTHLLWIDADMEFPPDALMRLLAHDKPIVGGLCFNRRPPYPPILMKLHNQTLHPGQRRYGFCYDYPPNGLFEVDATGGAFLLVKREVYEAIQAAEGPNWYDSIDGMSEDISFCVRAKTQGFPIYVDTGLVIGHVGEVVVDEAFAKRNRPYKWEAWQPLAKRIADGKPVATIVIPTYNQKPRFLAAAVHSAAHQTVPVEVIVVDDGSDVPVTSEGWPENVRLVRHGKNRGISTALNTGIEHMTADYFAWLSSDDLLDYEKIEKQLTAMETANFKASFHRWQAVTTEESKARVAAFPRWTDYREQMQILAQQCAINGSTVLVHKDVIAKVGIFDTGLLYSQDWEWFCRVGEYFFWYPVDEILCSRRVHDDNLTAQIEADEEMRDKRNFEDRIVRERYRSWS